MKKSARRNKTSVTIFLYNIRSVHNAGAIMRTADAIGISRVIFAGYTPAPVDRFGRVRADFTKASLGSEHSVSWSCAPKPLSELKKLKKDGHFLIALEQSEESVDYKDIRLPCAPLVIILGNEVSGIPREVLSFSNIVAEIPMRGKKESLNVSVSAGILLYRLFDDA